MSHDNDPWIVFAGPRRVTQVVLWLAAVAAGIMAAIHLAPVPTVPTCDGQDMTRGDRCATVAAGADISGYRDVLGGKDFDTMLAEQQQSYLDLRWGMLVITALILVLAVTATRRGLAVRRPVVLPEPAGAPSWHACAATGGVSGVIGAVLFGGLATAMVRYAGSEDFLSADVSVPVQWITGGLLACGFGFIYFVGLGRAARLVRIDDTGLVERRGTRVTVVAWPEITAVTPLTSWPITVTAPGRRLVLDRNLSDHAMIARHLQQRVPGAIGK